MKMNDLSNSLRPTKIEEFIGQSHIIGKDKALYKLIKKKEIPHLFFMENLAQGKLHLQKLLLNILVATITTLMQQL